jgi:transcriptional regulator with XRE-family HTH domain
MADQRHFIKQWREHRGLSQLQMAERIGIDKSYVSKIENGKKRYDQPFLEAAAEVLNCSPADLIVRDPSTSESIWSIWEQLAPQAREQVVEIAKTFKKAG